MRPNAWQWPGWRKPAIEIATWLKQARQRLAASDQPALDAQLLLSHALQKPRPWLLAHPNQQLTPEQRSQLDALLERYVSGEALPYILGHWEFFGHDFAVSPAVLIPRPETELMVEQALHWLKSRPGSRVIDVGTGSGCIAVSLACSIPELQIIASDLSSAALKVARHNARRHQVENRIHLVQANLLSAFKGKFDLVCANLPYIPTETLAGLDVARREPLLALDGGPDGLQCLRPLLQQLPGRLSLSALALLEIEANQGAAVLSLARAVLPHAAVDVLPDLASRPRLLRIETHAALA